MAFTLRRFTSRLLVLINLVTVAVFLVTCLAPYLNPAEWWFAGFSGLILPWLFFALIGFLLFWLFIKPKRCLISLAALLIGFTNIRVMLALNTPARFRMEKAAGQLRVMDWNVRGFTPYNTEKFNPRDTDNLQAIISEIKRYDPDVVCLQEFYSTDSAWKSDNVGKFCKELGFCHAVLARDHGYLTKVWSGTAIFSKFPILDSSRYSFSDLNSKSAESLISADILLGTDTIRVYTTHLQSFSFHRKDYNNLRKIRDQEDSGFTASKSLFYKMRTAFQKRAVQAEETRDRISTCPYPHVFCADLNDVPNSYAYFTVRGDRRDAFLEKGLGLGKSFVSGSSRFLEWLPTLRIDHIFTSRGFRTRQFTQVTRRLSDHRALIVDLELVK